MAKKQPTSVESQLGDTAVGGNAPSGLTRRRVVTAGTLLGASALAAPWLLSSRARAQGADLEAYQKASIDWRQAEGETIACALISAGAFDNLIAVTPTFEALTGITVQYQKIHPRDLRQKAILDLSAKTGNLHTSATDPMYYALYAANSWVDPLDDYLADSSLTDPAWFDVDDVIPNWRGANAIDGKLYGMPYMGEATIQIYRKDIYDQHGLSAPETLDAYMETAGKIHDPGHRFWGAALRGFAGPGQNMYIYPSIFRAYGGEWFDANGNLNWNTPEALAALEWYVKLLNSYAPPGVENWNWPDLGDAFSQGTVGSYIDGHTQAYLLTDPSRSRVADKMGFARWPKGPSGKRVTSIWNWGFPINAAISDRAKVATWLFIQWASSKETQIRTSYEFEGSVRRYGVVRNSIWQTPEYIAMLEAAGYNFIDATVNSMQEDTDVDWRPRVPQWPGVGDVMATAVQAALVGEQTPEQALATSQEKINEIMQQ
jgi:multiple sugar transport system substrate-binding protein